MWTVILPDSSLIDVVPVALMFLIFSWVGSIYCAYTACIQLHAILLQKVSEEKWRENTSRQIARSSVQRITTKR